MSRAMIALLLIPALLPAQTPAATPPAEELELPQKADAPKGAIVSDFVLYQMVQEMQRASRLRLLDPVYFIDYTVDDADMIAMSASSGALINQSRNRARTLRINLRVGSSQFDNTNSIYTNFYSGSRLDPDHLPLDNQAQPFRHVLWLATDRVYKTAAEAFSRKTAAQRNVTVKDPLPDFSPGQATRLLLDTPNVTIDENFWMNRVRNLSSIFDSYPAVTSSSVEFQASLNTTYYINSEGTMARLPDLLGFLTVKGSMQAPDGMMLYDGITVPTLQPDKMPSDTELRAATESVGRTLTELSSAPVGEAYIGPVLFEPRAAAQIVAEVFGAALTVPRRPVSEPARPLPFLASEFEGRMNTRVMPEWMDVVDDPSLKEWNGRTLLGHYPLDLEGQVPKPLRPVEKGMLLQYLMTRTPVRGNIGTNGRARLPGAFGTSISRISNLMLQPAKSEDMAALKARLVEMIKAQNKPYGIMVRKMDFPSSASFAQIRRSAARGAGTSRPVSTPVLLYRVYPDGKEELVRGLQFRNLNTRAFRDIMAASKEQYLFNYLDNGARFAAMGAGSYVVGCSVVSPGLLFEELELERPEEELQKLPLVPPPSAGR